jgi:sulfate permease, SulP family
MTTAETPKVGLAKFKGYRREWLKADIIGGITVTALLVPEGMAYAELAGVPPQAAFYAAPIALLMFALLGTSRVLVVAVSSAVSATAGSIVADMGSGDAVEFAALAAALAVFTGVIMILAGFLKLGKISEFFSESVLKGFVFGLAISITVRQIPKLLGFEGSEGNVPERLWDIAANIGETHGATIAIGLSSLAIMFGLEHRLPRLPAALITLIFGITTSLMFGLEDRGVEVIGEIPSGLAAPAVPDVDASQIGSLVLGGLGLGLLVFAEAIGPARQLGKKHGHEVDADRELIAMGASNVGAGFLQGFGVGATLSNSAANDRAGAKSSLSLIVAAALVAIVALAFTALFEPLPEATLGAIVIVAISSLMDVAALRRLHRLRRGDLFLSLVALTAVLFVESLQALLIAVVISLLMVLRRVSSPAVSRLGRQPGHLTFVDVAQHSDAKTMPGILIARPNAELFFANVSGVRNEIVEMLADSERPYVTVLLDLEMTYELDTPAADGLRELCEDLTAMGIELHLARVYSGVRSMLDRAGVTEVVGEQMIHTRLVDGLRHYLSSHDDVSGVDRPLLEQILGLTDDLSTLLAQEGPDVEERRAQLRVRLGELLDEFRRGDD